MMTIHVPKWLVWALASLLVAAAIAVAFLLGRSGGNGGSSDVLETGQGASVSPEEAQPATCSERAAKRAIAETRFESAVHEIGAVPAGKPLFGRFGYVISEVTCRDFTGDDIEEMMVQLACCTGGSSSPWAIFSPGSHGWELSFYRANIQAKLTVQGDAIVEKTPAYAAGDPTCCPTTFRFGRVTWDGSKFGYESENPVAGRTVKVSSRGVGRLGPFKPATGSPVEAAEAFGPPSYVGPNDELCVNEWRDLGLLINFANLGGADPCSAEGAVGSIELEGELAEQAGWETTEGVQVGMSEGELREIYPDAEMQSYPGLRNVLLLIEGPTIIGDSGSYPVLAARIDGGAVNELRMSVGAAGE